MTIINTNTVPEQIVLKTLRFKFSDELMEQLSIFAKIHEHDDRHIFKESWTEWIDDLGIKEIITKEIERVESLGFNGDILDKMYKSARYYYRKKSLTTTQPINRKEYEVVSKPILALIDAHIKTQIAAHIKPESSNNSCKNINITPADCFHNFCVLNQELILLKINENKNKIEHSPSDKIQVRNVMDKLKKIYKNRFYNIRVKLL
jgi:hypothetical protein